MRASSQTRSCVPLPWWTSKSTIATRSRPCASSAWRAPTTALPKRQKPIARRGLGVVAGRAHRAEGVARPRRPSPGRRRAPPRRRPRRAARQRAGAEEGVGVDRGEALAGPRAASAARCGGGVGAQQLRVRRPAAPRRGAEPAKSAAVERRVDRLEPRHPLGMAGRVDVPQAVGMRDQRGRHRARLGRRVRGFKGYSRDAGRAGDRTGARARRGDPLGWRKTGGP